MTGQHQLLRSADESSSIYDLGYRRYEGARLGRRHAVLALVRESLRAAFGLGRGWGAKVWPWLLIFIAVVPALIQLIIGALVPAGEIELVTHDAYYSDIKYILALYVGVIAPDVVGRDQRNRTLTLYFTRAITRTDYALGKLAAVTTAMLAITLIPQLMLFFGNALATDDFGSYAADHWADLFPILGTALFGSWLIASLATLIAGLTPQRAFATVGIIVAFVLPIGIAAVMVEEIDAGWTSLAVFVSPLELVDGLTLWIFQSGTGATIAELSGYHMGWFALVAAVVGLACTGLLVRRYARIQA